MSKDAMTGPAALEVCRALARRERPAGEQEWQQLRPMVKPGLLKIEDELTQQIREVLQYLRRIA